jgi:hypothetical protein
MQSCGSVGNYCYTTLVCQDNNPTLPSLEIKPQRIAEPTSTYVEQIVCVTKTVAIPIGHDGIVTTETQQLDKSKGTNVIWANATIKGVNHMEEFNHKNTRKEFDDVLNGRSYAPDTFRK